MGGTNKGKTNAGENIATNFGVGFGPFVSKAPGNALKKLFGRGAEYSVTGSNEGDKIAALESTSIFVFACFAPLQMFHNFITILIAVGGGTKIANLEINNIISTILTESPDK